MSTPAEQAAEFNRLIAEQGTLVRSIKFGYAERPGGKPTDVEVRRLARLAELVQLLNATSSVKYDVAKSVERWCEVNRLSLTNHGVQRVLDQISENSSVRLIVRIGDGGSAYYNAHEGDLTHDGAQGLCVRVPEVVAEQLRQQGRRALMREFARLMAVDTHV